MVYLLVRVLVTLAAAVRQPLFLVSLHIYLSRFVCRFSPLQTAVTAGRLSATWRSVSTK